MSKNGFTLIEAILATSLVSTTLVTLLLVRQNCLRQISRAAELRTAASVAESIINNWRICEPLQQKQIPLSANIEKIGLSWVCEIEDVEISPEQWAPGLSVSFFAESHSNKEPIASFAGVRYTQEPMGELFYE